MDVSSPITTATAAAEGTAGYRALREHAAVLDLSSRGKIRVAGEDRARLLHALTTNQVQALQPGEGCYAFFLNAQGRILGDANLFVFEDHILLDTEPEAGVKLYEHLDRYIIADDVTLEDLTGSLVTVALEGPHAQEILASAGAPIPEAPYSTLAWHNRTIARVDSTRSGGFFIFAPAAERESLLSQFAAVGAAEATPEDARIVRIEHGHPRYGEEITERYLLQETGQMQAVNFNKGCYLGQEIVERVRSRAQIHRVLKRLEIDSTEPPAPGTKLKVDDKDAAEIASAVFSPVLGKVVALAYVHTPHAEPGTALSAPSGAAIVTP